MVTKQHDMMMSIGKHNLCALDIETFGLRTHDAVYSVAVTPAGAYKTYWFKWDSEDTRTAIREIMGSSDINVIIQRAEFEARLLRKYGIKLRAPFEDTKLLQFISDENKDNGLKSMALERLNMEMSEYKDVCPGGDWNKIPDVLVEEYNAEDAVAAGKLYEPLLKEVKDQGLEHLYEMEKQVIPITVEMAYNGMPVSKRVLMRMQREYDDLIMDKVSEIYEGVGHQFNIASNPQLGHILFKEHGLPVQEIKEKSGLPSVDVSTLRTLYEDHDSELANQVLEYRFLTKRKSTYIDSVLKMMVDGRVYSIFNPFKPETGRMSSEKPNLQNIPPEIRPAYRPGKGRKFLILDYSQIELRIMAHESQDPELLRAYQEGIDLHQLTADELNIERYDAKTTNFKMLYLASPYNLMDSLGVRLSEARGIIELFYRKYIKVRPWQDMMIDLAQTRGYVETWYGRRRRFSSVIFDDHNAREAVNFPIQGGAGEVIKLAMIDIDKSGILSDDCKMVCQIHDCLIFDVKADSVTEAKKKYGYQIKDLMENAVTALTVPIVADMEVKDKWY
jgi:DNA polymerase-1